MMAGFAAVQVFASEPDGADGAESIGKYIGGAGYFPIQRLQCIKAAFLGGKVTASDLLQLLILLCGIGINKGCFLIH